MPKIYLMLELRSVPYIYPIAYSQTRRVHVVREKEMDKFAEHMAECYAMNDGRTEYSFQELACIDEIDMGGIVKLLHKEYGDHSYVGDLLKELDRLLALVGQQKEAET